MTKKNTILKNKAGKTNLHSDKFESLRNWITALGGVTVIFSLAGGMIWFFGNLYMGGFLSSIGLSKIKFNLDFLPNYVIQVMGLSTVFLIFVYLVTGWLLIEMFKFTDRDSTTLKKQGLTTALIKKYMQSPWGAVFLVVVSTLFIFIGFFVLHLFVIPQIFLFLFSLRTVTILIVSIICYIFAFYIFRKFTKKLDKHVNEQINSFGTHDHELEFHWFFSIALWLWTIFYFDVVTTYILKWVGGISPDIGYIYLIFLLIPVFFLYFPGVDILVFSNNDDHKVKFLVLSIITIVAFSYMYLMIFQLSNDNSTQFMSGFWIILGACITAPILASIKEDQRNLPFYLGLCLCVFTFVGGFILISLMDTSINQGSQNGIKYLNANSSDVMFSSNSGTLLGDWQFLTQIPATPNKNQTPVYFYSNLHLLFNRDGKYFFWSDLRSSTVVPNSTSSAYSIPQNTSTMLPISIYIVDEKEVNSLIQLPKSTKTPMPLPTANITPTK